MNYNDLKVHPVAALFPMMTDEELNDLAADIKANGLIHPIVVDAGGQLIDGRNRLEGCRRGDIKPSFTELNGQDPVAFILSCNVNRRHLNKGQQAMAVAKARNLSTKLTTREAAKTAKVSHEYVNRAAAVLDYAPELTDTVLAGATPLNDAYAEARRRKEAAESEEAKLERLQAEAPDLAVMVQEERLSLAGALAELAERKRKEEQDRQEELEHRRRVSRGFETALTVFDPAHMDPDGVARHFLQKADARLVDDRAEFTAERARRAADVLLRYATLIEEEPLETK